MPYGIARMRSQTARWNGVPIIVPCHRAVGADGALTGYLGGLQRPRALLDLEHRGATGEAPPPDWSMRQIALL